jgi:hypothetical protein
LYPVEPVEVNPKHNTICPIEPVCGVTNQASFASAPVAGEAPLAPKPRRDGTGPCSPSGVSVALAGIVKNLSLSS